MIPGLGNQARLFLISGGVGLGLGLCYDWGRCHRRVFPGLTVPVDVLYGLVLFLVLMLTAIYSRGLKLYQVLGMVLGGGLYFFLFSSWMLRPLRAILGQFRHIMAAVRTGAKKSVNFLRKLRKKLFSSGAKWSTIGAIPFSPQGKRTGKAGAIPGDSKHSAKTPGRRGGTVGGVESGRAGKRFKLRHRTGKGVAV